MAKCSVQNMATFIEKELIVRVERIYGGLHENFRLINQVDFLINKCTHTQTVFGVKSK